ncbi:hypothetical protein GUJ93_ZPchr0014g46669 [Zizania palustris]|uniref:Uncharacterized protein n=1 Tax=Zizania palustris TaxID=103762 RepID=A0A8J5W0F2_ZIZPA|nr:hypothetical protein GUJ93_ZPchr0014g46669 [Zizania palustris]
MDGFESTEYRPSTGTAAARRCRRGRDCRAQSPDRAWPPCVDAGEDGTAARRQQRGRDRHAPWRTGPP